MWGGKGGKLAPRLHVPARSVSFDQAENCMTELWLTGDAMTRSSIALHSASSPPLCRKLLHPQLAQHQVPGLLPHPAQFIPWHCSSHLWSYCTTLQTKAAEGQHMLITALLMAFWPWTGGKSPLWSCPCSHAPAPAAATCGADGQDLCTLWSHREQLQFFRELFSSKSTEGYQWIASYP